MAFGEIVVVERERRWIKGFVKRWNNSKVKYYKEKIEAEEYEDVVDVGSRRRRKSRLRPRQRKEEEAIEKKK